MVIVVENRIPVARGWEGEFERRWKHRRWTVDRLPGFIRTEVLRPIEGDCYIVKTYWRSMRDFQRWTKSDAFREAHANPPPKEAFRGPNRLEIHEVFAHRERPRTARRARR